jgi:hypothetical protein
MTHATHEFVAHHAHMVKIHGIEVDGQMSKGTDGPQALKYSRVCMPSTRSCVDCGDLKLTDFGFVCAGLDRGDLPLSSYFSTIKLR